MLRSTASVWRPTINCARPAGVEVTLDRPITDQLGTTTQTVQAFGDSVPVTTGTITSDQIKDLPSGTQKGGFAGQNFIDTTSGFVLSTDRPQVWTVDTTNGGHRFSANDGSSIVVDVREGARTADLDRVLHRTLDSLRRAGVRTSSQVDSASSTALVWYRDPATQETVCVKLTLANDRLYTARASTKDPSSVASLVRSVSSLTPITKPTALKRVPSVRGSTLQRR